eukprot:scaffold21244_cov60-Phaeocystis_antarctica.AAC.5
MPPAAAAPVGTETSNGCAAAHAAAELVHVLVTLTRDGLESTAIYEGPGGITITRGAQLAAALKNEPSHRKLVLHTTATLHRHPCGGARGSRQLALPSALLGDAPHHAGHGHARGALQLHPVRSARLLGVERSVGQGHRARCALTPTAGGPLPEDRCAARADATRAQRPVGEGLPGGDGARAAVDGGSGPAAATPAHRARAARAAAVARAAVRPGSCRAAEQAAPLRRPPRRRLVSVREGVQLRRAHVGHVYVAEWAERHLARLEGGLLPEQLVALRAELGQCGRDEGGHLPLLEGECTLVPAQWGGVAPAWRAPRRRRVASLNGSLARQARSALQGRSSSSRGGGDFGDGGAPRSWHLPLTRTRRLRHLCRRRRHQAEVRRHSPEVVLRCYLIDSTVVPYEHLEGGGALGGRRAARQADVSALLGDLGHALETLRAPLALVGLLLLRSAALRALVAVDSVNAGAAAICTRVVALRGHEDLPEVEWLGQGGRARERESRRTSR